MKEDYCNYDLSLALKACGFDEPCDHFYEHSWDPTKARISASGVYGEWNNIDAFKHNFNAIDDNRHKQSLIPYCSAPTLWQAQKWLREKWGIYAYCEPNCLKKWFARAVDLAKNEDLLFDGEMFDSFEKATEYAIAAALELIEKGE